MKESCFESLTDLQDSLAACSHLLVTRSYGRGYSITGSSGPELLEYQAFEIKKHAQNPYTIHRGYRNGLMMIIW